jgi:hypothetical protein
MLRLRSGNTGLLSWGISKGAFIASISAGICALALMLAIANAINAAMWHVSFFIFIMCCS